jgi:hypothetical protein
MTLDPVFPIRGLDVLLGFFVNVPAAQNSVSFEDAQAFVGQCFLEVRTPLHFTLFEAMVHEVDGLGAADAPKHYVGNLPTF